MVLNKVLVGFFGAVTGLLQRESCARPRQTSSRRRFQDLNLRAFEKVYQYGSELLIKLENGEMEETTSLESA
jgi:Pyruvate/2-oxoacid:ferredoxin oxidoreductase gamma subunit